MLANHFFIIVILLLKWLHITSATKRFLAIFQDARKNNRMKLLLSICLFVKTSKNVVVGQGRLFNYIPLFHLILIHFRNNLTKNDTLFACMYMYKHTFLDNTLIEKCNLVNRDLITAVFLSKNFQNCNFSSYNESFKTNWNGGGGSD